jgi:RNA polymerase sigma factor (sigma-70 family)
LDVIVGEDGPARHELIEDPTPERLAEDYQETQLHTRLMTAIEQLPSRDREIITLRLRGVPGIEIAKAMSMSPPNVTHICNRVIERLRRMLTTQES